MRVKSFLALAEDHVRLSDRSIERSGELIGLGFSDLDALHIAMAEEGKAEYFVTCDDGIVNVARRCHDSIDVSVRAVLDFFTEVMKSVENGQ
jgi:hypothetical protein